MSLVLAVDSSASINLEEYTLQIAGYASAFTDPEVQAAMATAGIVDLALVFWADSDFSPRSLPWHRISSPADALQFSAAILASRRLLTGDTDIGTGLSAALDMLEMPGRCTRRAVVNVSGDGKASMSMKRNSTRIDLPTARARALDLGVTVNGLAILNDEPDLAEYYSENLIVGEGAFVEQVISFDDFAMAIRKKIVREIGVILSSSNDQPLSRPATETVTATGMVTGMTMGPPTIGSADGPLPEHALAMADLHGFVRMPPH